MKVNLVQPKTKNCYGECTDNSRYATYEFLRTYADQLIPKTNEEILALATDLHARMESGAGRLPPECDIAKVDALVAAIHERIHRP